MSNPFLLIAHRGHPTGHEENSLDGFLFVVSRGAQAIEFDVQLTQDGVPVVFHDEDMARMCGIEGKLSDFLYQDLPTTLEGHRIMALNDVLEVLKPTSCLLHVEIKNKAALHATQKCIDRHQMVGQCQISSFLHDIFEPQLWNGWGGSPSQKGIWLVEGDDQQAFRSLQRKPVLMDYGVSHELTDIIDPLAIKGRGYVFTVNTLKSIVDLQCHGWAGVYTDCIDQFIQHGPIT